MKARKYTQRVDGEWFAAEPEHKIACCDCGLIHLMEFRIRKGVLEMRAFRDNRATAQRRRRRKLACVPVG